MGGFSEPPPRHLGGFFDARLLRVTSEAHPTRGLGPVRIEGRVRTFAIRYCRGPPTQDLGDKTHQSGVAAHLSRVTAGERKLGDSGPRRIEGVGCTFAICYCWRTPIQGFGARTHRGGWPHFCHSLLRANACSGWNCLLLLFLLLMTYARSDPISRANCDSCMCKTCGVESRLGQTAPGRNNVGAKRFRGEAMSERNEVGSKRCG